MKKEGSGALPSITIQPAIRSFVSANGPSVTGGRPGPSYRTNVPSGASA